MNNIFKEALLIEFNHINLEGNKSDRLCNEVNFKFTDTLLIDDNNITYGNFNSKLDEYTQKLTINGEDQFDPKIHKKYYRYPKINLSRDKMDHCKTKYKMAKVLNPDKADFKVIGRSFMKSVVQTWWNVSLSSTSSLIKFLEKYKDHQIWKKDTYKSIIDKISEYPEDLPVLLQEQRSYYMEHKNDNLKEFLEKFRTELPTESGYFAHIKTKHIDHVRDIITNKALVVSDVFMNNLASEDSHILTGEDYKTIRKLLKGSHEDKTVGMNIMANCNIQKSKTYLSLLFFHFSETLRGGPLWNQVGFKTLKSEFEKYSLEHNHYHSNRYSDCIKLLVEDDALTVEAAEHILGLVFKNVITSSTGINQEDSVFVLERPSLKLTPEVKQRIRKGESLSKIVSANTVTDDLPF